AGNVSNAGSITAPTGIAILHSTIAGQIIDSGNIQATSHGILVDSTSKVSTGNSFAIEVTGPTFLGGISVAGTLSAGISVGTLAGTPVVTTFGGGIANSGTIAFGTVGVVVNNVVSFTGGVTNSGAISGVGFNGVGIAAVSTFSGGVVNLAGG